MTTPFSLPVQPGDIAECAVAICKANGNHHTAMIFRSTASSLRVLHIYLNGTIACEPFPHKRLPFAWVIPNISDVWLEQVAALCESIGAKSRRVPYGLKFSQQSKFMPNGDFSPGAGTFGLTCATFVLAVFHVLGFDLVDDSSWQYRPEDANFQTDILGHLAGDPSIPPAEVRQNIADVPCVRFRPEEVVAACRRSSHPMSFGDAKPAGAEIVGWIAHFDRWRTAAATAGRV